MIDYRDIKYLDNMIDDSIIDPLTQVFSRTAIINIAKGLIKDNIPFTIMILDLDNFKQINDSFGHLSGDFILKSVGEKLKKFCYKDIYVGRYGGDEFLLLMSNVVEYDDVHHKLESLYERNKIFRKYYNDGLRDIYLTATLGCAKYPDDEKDYEKLFAKADKALYRGKIKGRNCYIIYVESKHKDIVVHEKAEGSLIKLFNSSKRLFDIYKGKKQIIKSTVDFLYSHLHCSYVYFLTNERTYITNYNDEEKRAIEYYELHLEKILNGDTIFFETPLTKYKANDEALANFLNSKAIQSIMVSKLKTYKTNYGYLIIAEKEITRIWQEHEIALVMYVSTLLEMELMNIDKDLN